VTAAGDPNGPAEVGEAPQTGAVRQARINYGAGNDVSEESIDDASAPVRIRWREGSYIDIPVGQSPAPSP